MKKKVNAVGITPTMKGCRVSQEAVEKVSMEQMTTPQGAGKRLETASKATGRRQEAAPGTDAQQPAAPQIAGEQSVVEERVYGYIRVSSREQNEARQVVALREFGVDRVFMDKQSGKDFNRPAYQEMLGQLRPGDVLVIKSIDRLGRNYEEILNQWRRITKDLGADIVVLDMDLLDTRRGRDLTGTLIADIVLQLLSYVAETERAFIRQRQKEGIAAARARGQKFGPPQHPRPAGYEELADEWRAGRISAREAGRRLGVPHPTFLHWAREESWAR